MKTSSGLTLFLLALAPALLGTDALAQPGQAPRRGAILIPDSTVEYPEDIGSHAHTNHLILVHEEGQPAIASAPAGETPQSISAVYELGDLSARGSGIIVIVDAFDYPTAENDLNVFSRQFGLPPCTTAKGCFTKIYANGSKPRANCGWAQEAALDIEWAHAMAPNAKIVLVEAASNSFSNLFKAVDVGTQFIQEHGGVGEVSMSWGGSEFSGETAYDAHFVAPADARVVYFAASGDTGGVNIYPSVSPNVVSAGGSTIHRDANGNFTGETAWSGSGGGPSKYEARPAYQDVILDSVGSRRGAPDFSFDADPASGVSVYDSTPCNGRSGWLVFGGTSVAAPSLAGIVNAAGSFAASSASELSTIYSYMGSTKFRDIISGSAGNFSAAPGWDFVTGVGTSLGLSGK